MEHHKNKRKSQYYSRLQLISECIAYDIVLWNIICLRLYSMSMYLYLSNNKILDDIVSAKQGQKGGGHEFMAHHTQKILFMK